MSCTRNTKRRKKDDEEKSKQPSTFGDTPVLGGVPVVPDPMLGMMGQPLQIAYYPANGGGVVDPSMMGYGNMNMGGRPFGGGFQ